MWPLRRCITLVPRARMAVPSVVSTMRVVAVVVIFLIVVRIKVPVVASGHHSKDNDTENAEQSHGDPLPII